MVKITPIQSDDNEKDSQNDSPLKVGAELPKLYLPILENKKVAVVGNQTSMIEDVHIVDFLLKNRVEVVKVFSPEHGFRGDADAGEKVDSDKDEKTGLPIVSLYGKNKKPTSKQLEGVDILVFDIQDVGARFYTYISTLHYIMESAAENKTAVLVLDRPNPHGSYVDGPVRKKGYESFVGMHPIPIIHGMTIGEYAKMINGEGWLENAVKCELHVIECQNYDRNEPYDLPISPSPNLRSFAAVQLYPSLCLFEGTQISVGRGTERPFEIFGHPAFKKDSSNFNFTFTPKPSFGAKNPKLNGEKCYGKDLQEIGGKGLNSLNINWLIEAYNTYPGNDFFITKNRWFDLLAGSDELRKSIIAGKSSDEIKDSWKKDLDDFRGVREKYLIYKSIE